jgi:hypothetical protein
MAEGVVCNPAFLKSVCQIPALRERHVLRNTARQWTKATVESQFSSIVNAGNTPVGEHVYRVLLIDAHLLKSGLSQFRPMVDLDGDILPKGGILYGPGLQCPGQEDTQNHPM